VIVGLEGITGFLARSGIPHQKCAGGWGAPVKLFAPPGVVQVRGEGSGATITSAGIYGPALANQNKPMNEGMLMDIGMLSAPVGELVAIRKSITSERIDTILKFMREGRAYVLIATEAHPGAQRTLTGLLADAVRLASAGTERVAVRADGALRGQVVTPICLEGELESQRANDNMYGFANAMLSPDAEDEAVAFLIQYAPGVSTMTARLARRGEAGMDLDATLVNTEAKPTDAQYTDFGDVASYVGQRFRVDRGIGEDYRALVHEKFMWVEVSDSNGLRLQGNMTEAQHCRRLLGVEDNLFSLASKHGNDWLTVWSMNSGNPDTRKTLEPRYFAHPLEVTLGESLDGIIRRFGTTEAHLKAINPAIVDLESLVVGATLCVIPDWSATVSGNGARTCVF